MDAGILRALKTVKNNPYVQYVGLGLAGLVTQKELCDEKTGKPLKKSKIQLIRISAAVCGIELCYAAETAFVSPILLKLGVPTSLMTMVWCLSPVLGFFLVPVMGSLSDRCRFKLGRRRPFIILLSIGIILGLALVPNGEILGVLLGDSDNSALGRPSGVSTKGMDNNMFSQLYNVSNNRDSDLENDPEVTIYKPFSVPDRKVDEEDSSNVLSFSVPSGRLRGIILTIMGVAMLDFACDACQSPCRAYLLDISLPEDHSTGLTMFTVMAGAGGAVGYLMGGIDWNATSFGEAFGGHIRIVFTIVLLAFLICMALTLTSFKEIPLSDLSVSSEVLQKKKKRKGGRKYRRFTNEDSTSAEDDDDGDEEAKKLGIDPRGTAEMYGSLSSTIKANTASSVCETNGTRLNSIDYHKSSGNSNVTHSVDPADLSRKNSKPDIERTNNHIITTPDQHPNIAKTDPIKSSTQENANNHSKGQALRRMSLDASPNKTSNGIIPSSRINASKSFSSGVADEVSLYAGWISPDESDLQPTLPDTVQVSTDITLKTYLKSIVRMPRCMWILCLCNLLCWMSLVCYSLYFTDFVGQAVFGGNPHANGDSESHSLYDQGVRLGSFGMSLYSLSCAGYSMVIEKLVNRFQAKRVYVVGQLVFTVGMATMAVTRHRVAVVLLSPSAGIMYATLFTMPYLLVAHYHTRGLFCHGEVAGRASAAGGNGDGAAEEPRQVRGLGTDVAIISSMVFLAQFLLSVFMGTLVSLTGSTVTVVIASSGLSFLGALTATQLTYLDL